jgi:hypothetical protein
LIKERGKRNSREYDKDGRRSKRDGVEEEFERYSKR